MIEELQLGVKLNECVHSQRRYDFSLMLAMLVDNVCEFSQFGLPLTEQTPKEATEASLRKLLNVIPNAPLAISSLDDIKHFQQGQLVADNKLATMRLVNALQPKAIAFRNDAKHIPSSVMANTSLYCQQTKSGAPKKRLPFNVNAWLSSVQETVVKSPLMA
nr:VC2046/SO_2500 family protein [Thalassotalea piscium]